MIAKSQIGQEIERALDNYKQIKDEIETNPDRNNPDLIKRYLEVRQRLKGLSISVNPISVLEEKIEQEAQNNALKFRDAKNPKFTDIQDPGSYIILPGRTHGTYFYPDLLVYMERDFHYKTWGETHEVLHQNNAFMLTIRQHEDFIELLKAEKAFDGNGKKVDTAWIKIILGGIITIEEGKGAEWLDARFEKRKKEMWMHYNHRIVNEKLQPQNSEPLKNYLMKDCYADLSSFNEQGLPTRESEKSEYIKERNISYFAPINNMVAWYGCRVGLICCGNPSYRDSTCGVRIARFYHKANEIWKKPFTGFS